LYNPLVDRPDAPASDGRLLAAPGDATTTPTNVIMQTNFAHAPSQGSRDRFCRYEFKYRLPRGLASPVRAFVATHLPHDPYSLATVDHHYDICSLYLDSADLRLCRESLNGIKNRFKLRIRGYDDLPDSPVYLEIKRRLNTVIMKDRCSAPRCDLATFSSPTMNQEDSPAAAQFRFYRAYLAATPQALVRYRREAFEGDGPSRVRVTFDRDLRTRLTGAWDVHMGGCGWRNVLHEEVVLEIKFNGRYPAWLQEMVRRYQLQARSVSKYTMSLNAGTPAAFGLMARQAEG
jgi:hypothetical protein